MAFNAPGLPYVDLGGCILACDPENPARGNVVRNPGYPDQRAGRKARDPKDGAPVMRVGKGMFAVPGTGFPRHGVRLSHK